MEPLRAKWLMDGSATLADAADALEQEARRLRLLHGRGWTLQEPVQDDSGFLVPPAAPTA